MIMVSTVMLFPIGLISLLWAQDRDRDRVSSGQDKPRVSDQQQLRPRNQDTIIHSDGRISGMLNRRSRGAVIVPLHSLELNNKKKSNGQAVECLPIPVGNVAYRLSVQGGAP